MRLDQTLISIRERHQVDLFDLALVVIRRRPWPLAWAAFGGFAPFVALNAWVFAWLGEAGSPLGLILWWFEAPVAAAPLTVVLGKMMFGEPLALRGMIRQLGRSAGTLLMTHGVLRFLPGYWLPPRLVFSNEMILLEHAVWAKLWKRGADLAGGREGTLFFQSIFQVGAIWTFATVIDLGLGRLLQAVLAEDLTWDWPESTVLTSLVYQVPIWLGVGFLAVVRFLTYIDQRIRLEGWEIKLRLHAAAEAMAEDQAW